MAAVPKSVAFIDKHPYLFNRFLLGTRFNSWISMLRNMFIVINEQTDFSLLGNCTLVQSTGGDTAKMDISVGVDFIIDGVAYTKAVENNIAVGAATTAAGEYRAITVAVNASGTTSQTVSAVAAAAPVTPPAVPANECPLATIQIPASFTPGTTTFLTAWVTNGWTAQQTITETNVSVLPDTNT